MAAVLSMQNSVVALKQSISSYQHQIEQEHAYIDEQRRQLMQDWSLYQHGGTGQRLSSAPSKGREYTVHASRLNRIYTQSPAPTPLAQARR